jgi:DNA-binding response OmpR family regulator
MSNILFVEPNLLLARTYVAAVQHAGYDARYARSAQDAITAADTQCPDVVLLELELPSHDGIEFLHEFRSYSEWMDVPVVLLTNVTPPTLAPLEKQLEEDFGIRMYLYKPQASLQKIITAVRALL